MRRFLGLSLAAVALFSLGVLFGWHTRSSGTAFEPQYRSGPVKIGIEVIPATPRVGKNRLRIAVQTLSGEPVVGATIRAVAEMPAMGAMPAMQAPAEVHEIRPGLYEGSFDLSMEGSWPLSLTIQAPGFPERRLNFDMATGRAGLKLTAGASPIDAGEQPEEASGSVILDPSRRQLIGVKTAPAQMVDMTRTIRAVGRITYDETRLADVTLKFDAWIGKLFVDYVGARVKRGQPLFAVYGPQLLAAQQEYVELKRRAGRSEAASALLAAARKRLSLWDMTPGEIETLERRGVPHDYVPIHAPISGTVVMKNVVEGTAQKAGVTLMRIADLRRVWVEAQVYEAELPLVHAGLNAEVQLPYLPGERFTSTVDYVYPYLEGASRTGRIRLVLANPEGKLMPDMYAEVRTRLTLAGG